MKLIAGDRIRAVDLNWPNRYSIPYDVMGKKNNNNKREKLVWGVGQGLATAQRLVGPHLRLIISSVLS